MDLRITWFVVSSNDFACIAGFLPQEIIVLYKQPTSISHPQKVIMIACKKLRIVLCLFYILMGAAFVINVHVCGNNVCINNFLKNLYKDCYSVQT